MEAFGLVKVELIKKLDQISFPETQEAPMASL
jgi:hypothetical protein